MKTRILNLHKDHDMVYWDVVYEEDGQVVNRIEYRTNKSGNGIWRWIPWQGVWNQTDGTCQFSLHQETMSGMRRALYRHF